MDKTYCVRLVIVPLAVIIGNVDDILTAFDKEQESLNFLSSLNKRHPNIIFPIEKKLNIPSIFLMYSFQVSIIKISLFKHIPHRLIQGFS